VALLGLASLTWATVATAEEAEPASPGAPQQEEAQATAPAPVVPDRYEELAKQLADERAARQASEAKLAADQLRLSAEVEERATARMKEMLAAGKPRVSGSEGLTLSGFAQVDLWFRQSSEDQLNSSTAVPLNQDRFLLRRSRLRASYEAPYVLGALELDANTVNSNQVRVVGVEASVRWPGADPLPLAMFTVGSFKIPFGWEVRQSDTDRTFLERSTAIRALFPGEYDFGARLQGGWRFLRYSVAAMNGEPLGERTFPALDPNHSKDVVGRVGMDTAIGTMASWIAGVSAVWGRGFHKGTPATKPTTVWQDRNENGAFDNGELTIVPGQAATASANFSRFGLGIDARVTVRMPYLGDTTAYGEVVWAKNLDRAYLIADPVGSGRDLREMGYYVALVQDVGKHLQLGARYDYYNPDRDSTGLQAAVLVPSDQSYKTFALAAALRFGSARFVAEYDVNRNHLGRTSTGVPTNMKDNLLAFRSEVKF
jgi:hypothetical protein